MREAEEVFARQVERWRATSWGDLRSQLEDSPVVYDIEGSAGVTYQFEILVLWDDPRKEPNIRVIIASDDGNGWRMFGLRGDSFSKALDGSFVGE